jgi:hypothetical protein
VWHNNSNQIISKHIGLPKLNFSLLDKTLKDLIGGGFTTTDFFNDTNNLEWKHQQQ